MKLSNLHLHWGGSSYKGKKYKTYFLARSYRENGKNRKENVLLQKNLWVIVGSGKSPS